jgi:predicted pyridoxine 5'-phosphate oxidase superfamily flavin-nucleotide-binding protein
MKKQKEAPAMNRQELMELFNKYPRIGVLATANKEGDVNAAVFGSPQMIDENTVVMGIGENRSYRNLQRNPKAVFIVVEPGETVMDWKGARVYLEAVDMETYGKFFDQIKQNIAKAAGEQAAKMIQAAVRFKITEVRPIVDVA